MAKLNDFSNLVALLLNTDNNVRNAAEEAYEKIDKNDRIQYLFLIAKSSECDLESRQMCLVLLRRLLTSDGQELWSKWASTDRSAFLNELFALCQNEPSEMLRKRCAECIAEILRNSLDEMEDEQTWKDILTFVVNCSKSDALHNREIALHIFENVPGMFGEHQQNYLDVAKTMILSGLQETVPLSLKLYAIKAAAAFLCFNATDKPVLKHLQCILPDILKVTLTTATEEDSDEPLQCLADIATSCPKFLRHHLAELCTMCLKIVSNTDKEDMYRHGALEILVSLAESSAPMMRKDATRFIPDIIQQCLGLMIEVEDDDEWEHADEYDEEDLDNNAAVGETSLDRLSCSLGGKSVLQPTLKLVSPMMHQANWKHRYAGLMALSTIGEGCHQQMENVLEAVISGIINYLGDSHPRVRFAACNALGQLSTDFAPTLQKRYAEKIVPALLATLDCLDHPRVAANAAAALVNFCDDAPTGIMLTYLDRMMTKFHQVLQLSMKMMAENKRKLVLEQIVTTIAAVADNVEDHFAPYYDSIMPCLKYIMQHFNDPSLKLLRGKTIECLSLIGLAVGKDKFLPDADETMQLLLNAQVCLSDIEVDDPQISYMISAWTRICRLMGPEFRQYLPAVMPTVMKAASFKPEVTIVGDEETANVADDGWEFVKLGDQQNFGVKTSGLEEKATACEMLVCYARELKGAFVDYVEEVTKLMVPLLKFYFHDGVRTAAAESLPYLLEAAKVKGPQFVAEMWKYIFPDLLKAIESDSESEVLAEHMSSLAKCIECLGVGCLTEPDMRKIVEVIDERLKKHFEKSSERDSLRRDEDYDEEVEQDLNDEHKQDATLLARISDIFHALFMTYRENVLPYFELLLPHFVRLLDPKMPSAERQWGVCFYDDAVEYGGEGAVKYLQTFLQPMLHALGDQAPEVRQAAAYGFGVMGMHGGNLYAQACAEAIPFLVKIIISTDSRHDESSSYATENSIAAIAKILKYNSSMVNMEELLPAFITWLPIWEDDDELPHVYDYFCELIEANHPLVIGENHGNLPHLVKIIAQAFVKNKMVETEETIRVARRMCSLVRQIQSNPQALAACTANLTQNEAQALHEMMSTTAA